MAALIQKLQLRIRQSPVIIKTDDKRQIFPARIDTYNAALFAACTVENLHRLEGSVLEVRMKK